MSSTEIGPTTESQETETLSRKVTRADVIWCYRKLLNREPESERAIQSQYGAKSVGALMLNFLASGEFKKRFAATTVGPRLDLPPPQIESSATRDQLAQCLERIRSAWAHMGVSRPHHSVVSAPIFLPEHIDKTIDQFWQSGTREAEVIAGQLRQHGFGNTQSKTCVEFGCGLGRVTMPLTTHFQRVHAYDVSEPHLALAKDRAHALEVKNVSFHCNSGDLLRPLEKCDFFYSRIVFQHNPPPVIVELIRLALRSLNRGGLAMFQLPVYIAGYDFSIQKYLNASFKLDMEMHCLPQSDIFNLIASEGCRVLDVREDGSIGRRDIGISNTFVVAAGKTDTASEPDAGAGFLNQAAGGQMA